MGGANCAVAGCGAYRKRHKALSFHVLPKYGNSEKTDEWRRQLISTACLADKPDTVFICSRHFDDSCFLEPTTGNPDLASYEKVMV